MILSLDELDEHNFLKARLIIPCDKFYFRCDMPRIFGVLGRATVKTSAYPLIGEDSWIGFQKLRECPYTRKTDYKVLQISKLPLALREELKVLIKNEGS